MNIQWSQFYGDGRFSEYVIENVIRSFAKPADVVLDGGANEGRHTLAGLSTGASVIAVEPIPEFAQLIEQRADREGYDRSRLTVISMALSHETGTASFTYCPTRSTLSGLHARSRLRDIDVRELTVEKTTIDRVVDRLGVPPPALIKLDLEGGEFDAIRGASQTLTHRPLLVFEHGGVEGAKLYGYTNEQYYRHLEALGYTLLQINGRTAALEDFLKPRHWNYLAVNIESSRHRELLDVIDYLNADAAQKMYVRHKVSTSV